MSSDLWGKLCPAQPLRRAHVHQVPEYIDPAVQLKLCSIKSRERTSKPTWPILIKGWIFPPKFHSTWKQPFVNI